MFNQMGRDNLLTELRAAKAEIELLRIELEEERLVTEALREDNEGTVAEMEDVLERAMSRKYTLERISNASLSMFSSADDMIRWMKRQARGEYEKYEDSEVSADGEETTEEEYGVGPEGAD